MKQDRDPTLLDGTKINIAAQVLNTVSEFSGILREVNEHSRVIADGWFEPAFSRSDLQVLLDAELAELKKPEVGEPVRYL